MSIVIEDMRKGRLTRDTNDTILICPTVDPVIPDTKASFDDL